jgi:four helix bundle protein
MKGDNMARDFHNIIAWQRADDLVVEVYRRTVTLLRSDHSDLVRQLRSAAVSVPANLAEGSGRSTKVDFRRFLYQAQGSLSEVEYYLHLAGRLEILDSDSVRALSDLRVQAGKTLTGLIKSVSPAPE